MSEPTPIRSSAPAGAPPPTSNGGNGGLTRHRLEELEQRMGMVEGKVDDLRNTCTRIETKLDNVGTKSYVLWILGGTSAVLVLSLVGHLLIRSFSSG